MVVKPEVSRDVVSMGLQAMGAIVDDCIAYRTVAETEDPTGAVARLREEGADLITFTSASTAEHFSHWACRGRRTAWRAASVR